MTKRFFATVALAGLLLSGCATSPLGRSQLILFPEAEMAQMGATAFQDMQKQEPISKDGRASNYVKCVSNHVIRAIPGGDPSRWEVRVFQGDAVNAFALPGGKIGVYTGLLKVAENQHQLAAVIGHEIAHVSAKHANERVSTQFVTESGLQVAQIAAGASSPAKQELFGLLGLGAQVGILLPFSRTQESEADLIGLDYMANAGFDPRQAVALWRNMEKAGGERPPDFLSTHPSGSTRITDLDARMSSAMERYQQARAAGRVPDCAR
jgi:predicted Zn-dependent protease